MKEKNKNIYAVKATVLCYNTSIMIKCTVLVKKFIGENDNCISIFGNFM